MRNGKRTPDYHRIKNQSDALYYAADIPSIAWGPTTEEKPRFKLTVLDDQSVSPKTQDDWFDRMRSGEFFSLPYLILLSSTSDDDTSIVHGYDLMKRALSKGLRVQITDSAGVHEEIVRDESVFMLTNIYDEAPPERIQAIRDWCHKHKSCFRILCAGGDPATLMRRVKLKFNAVFHMDSAAVVERNLA